MLDSGPGLRAGIVSCSLERDRGWYWAIWQILGQIGTIRREPNTDDTTGDLEMLSKLAITALELMWGRPDGFPSSKLQAALGMHGSARTIRNALSELETKGYATPTSKTKGRAWRPIKALPAARRPSVNEAMALLTLRHLAERHLPASVVEALKPNFVAAKDVLREHPTAANLAAARLWMDKTARLHGGYPLIPPAVRDEFFQLVGHALYNDESLDITYRTALDAAPKEYRAIPHALIEKGPLWYLVVQTRRSSGQPSDLFALRMDRIVELKPMGVDLPRDPHFSLNKFIREERTMEFFPGAPVVIELKVTEYLENGKRVEHAFRSLKLSDDQTIEESDGGFLVRATVIPSIPLTNLLLEKSTTVEVISPASMRDQMMSHLKHALAKYEAARPVENSGNQPTS